MNTTTPQRRQNVREITPALTLICTVSRISKITNILGQNINFYRQKLWVKVDLYIPPFALLYKTQLFGGILTI
jgi:hypothetical protein